METPFTPAPASAWHWSTRDRWWIAALLTLAALVRFAGAARLDIGPDEGHSIFVATSPLGILTALHGDTNPPLYFFLLKIWTSLFGITLQSIRSLSALFGLALIPLLASLARKCGAAKPTACWIMILTAFVPLQIFYAQEARGYTLDVLLAALAMWTFLRAVHSNRMLPWILHALAVAAGAYAHFMLIPLAAGFWLAALLMRLPKRQFAALAVAHLAAALLAAPAIWMLLQQIDGTPASSGDLDWIAAIWRQTPPALAIPLSLEVLGLGGWLPAYLPMLSMPPSAAAFTAALTLLALAAAFWPNRPSAPAARQLAGWHEFGNDRWLLTVLAVWPLAFMWLYSCCRTPIYIVGRYDILAQPAYLCLLATGFSRLTTFGAKSKIENRKLKIENFIPALAALLMAWGIINQWSVPNHLVPPIHRQRAEYFSNETQPGDLIICTGLEASPTLYYLQLHSLHTPLETFPPETLSHLGWLESDRSLLARQPELKQQAADLITHAENSGTQTLWFFLDRPALASNDPARWQTSQLILDAAYSRGWRLRFPDPTHRQTESHLQILSLSPPDPIH